MPGDAANVREDNLTRQVPHAECKFSLAVVWKPALPPARTEFLRRRPPVHFHLPSSLLRPYPPAPMFENVKANLTAASQKLIHLRRFL